MLVKPIDEHLARKIVSRKHYSRALGIFWEGFGLFQGEQLIGVCIFGQPSPSIQKHAFKERKGFFFYELTRLVVEEGIKNGASFLISHALQMLHHRPAAIISYADTAHGHCGIVYQATNWEYTGPVCHNGNRYLYEGKLIHPITVRDKLGRTDHVSWAKENNIPIIPAEVKHRYFFFIGSATEKNGCDLS